MNNKEIVEKVHCLETQFNVLEIKYGNVLFWPYVRQLVSLHLVKNTTVNKKRRKQFFYTPLFSLFRALRYIYLSDRVHNLKKASGTDALILIDSSSRQEKINNKYYCRTADAITDFFENKLNLVTWEYSLKNNYPQPRYRSTEYIDTPLFTIMVLGVVKGVFCQLINPKLANSIKALNRLMYTNDISVQLPPIRTVCKIYSILFLARYFEFRLKQIKPKIVFIPEFYNAISMALSLASYRCNVKSIEYQHGAQNDYHRMYTHWDVIPKNGYALLPKYFWSWGDVSANRIRHWASKTNYHKVVVGGNLWMLRNKNGLDKDDVENKEFRRFYPNDMKHILVTLQKWPDHFNFTLLSIIKDSPPNWYWHIRQHPLHKIPANDIEKYFIINARTKKNLEIDYSSQASLYNILSNVDVHLTGFSTVAFEAQALGVPTIFFHENANHGFSGLIDNQDFYYADTQPELQDCLKKLLQGEMYAATTSSDYILASKKVASDALATIMGAD